MFDNGITTTREVKIEEIFSAINVNSMFDIVLVQDTINKVRVTCGKNLQSLVYVGVIKDILSFEQDTKYNWSRKYEKIRLEVHLITIPPIYIHQPSSIKNKGILKSSDFTLVDLGKFSEVDLNVDVNTCGIYMSSDNFGYFKIKGKCVYLDLWGWGSSIVRADSLKAENCSVLQRGIGNVYVNTSNELKVSLEYSGNVYYTGNPSSIIVEEQKSTGQLIKMP